MSLSGTFHIQTLIPTTWHAGKGKTKKTVRRSVVAMDSGEKGKVNR
jgi:hypothetical protein